MEHDGLDDAVEGVLRVAVTVAGMVGENMARKREAELKSAAARSQAEAAQMMRQQLADRQAAAGQLREINAPGWWDRANGEAIGRVWETARAWEGMDPAIDAAVARIADEVSRRHGIDVRDPGLVDAGSVQRRLAEREAMAAELAAREQRRRDEATVAALPVQPEREQVSAVDDAWIPQPVPVEQAPAPAEPAAAEVVQADGYDTDERRLQLVRGLEDLPGAEPDAVEARQVADVAQGRPAAEAVAADPGRAPRARRARGRGGRVQEQQRGR